MDLSLIIFDVLGFVASATGFACGIYVLSLAYGYVRDIVIKINMTGMGIIYFLLGTVFFLTSFHVMGFEIIPSEVSLFSKVIRPLVILSMLFPTFISYRMSERV